MKENEQFEDIIRNLASMDQAPSPNPLKKASARRSFLEHAARLRSGTSSARSHRRGSAFVSGLFRFAIAGPTAVFVALALLTSVAYAADGARPGDALYPLDLEVEKL